MKTHLVFALMTVALLAFVISQSSRKSFTFDTVVAQARALSLEDYHPPQPPADPLRKLNYDQARDIRFNENESLWRKEGFPFQVRFFFSAGEHNSTPVTIFQINREGAGPLHFAPSQFNFGPLVHLSDADKAAGAYSGFRLYYSLNKPDQLDEILVFQGASYFRPLAKNLLYGLSARGIAIDTLGREDFPGFTRFWLVEPARGASEMKLYALLEGRDVTGAYEFRLAPGVETKIHVRAVLYPRERLKDVGFAPLTSMFWYGENTSNTFGNWRPEVHDSDGLQIQRASGEWIWRPLAWATQRQVNVFADKNPKGFGLFQRDRDFSHYQDLEARYNERPSAWVQPDGDWGGGAVVLMQNPTKDEFADNIVAYWRPDRGLQKSERFEFAYTLTTFGEKSGLPPLGRCISTRIDYQNEAYFRRVVLVFDGGELGQVPPEAGIEEGKPLSPNPISADIWAGTDGAIPKVSVQKIPNSARWQVSFTVSTAKTNQPIEIGCRLTRQGKPLTETWTYTWVK